MPVLSTTRRSALAGAVALLAAAGGCLSGTSRGVADVFVRNDTGEQRTVAVLVRYDDGDPALDRTVTVAAGEERKFNNEVVQGTDCRVEVRVRDGPADTYEWTGVDGALRITIGSAGIAFSEDE